MVTGVWRSPESVVVVGRERNEDKTRRKDSEKKGIQKEENYVNKDEKEKENKNKIRREWRRDCKPERKKMERKGEVKIRGKEKRKR